MVARKARLIILGAVPSTFAERLGLEPKFVADVYELERLLADPDPDKQAREAWVEYLERAPEMKGRGGSAELPEPGPIAGVAVDNLSHFGSTRGLAHWLNALSGAGIKLYSAAHGPEPLNEHMRLILDLGALDMSAVEKAQQAQRSAEALAQSQEYLWKGKFDAWVRQFSQKAHMLQEIGRALVSNGDGSHHLGVEVRGWREKQGLTRKALAEKLSELTGEEITESKIVRLEDGSKTTIPTELLYDLMYPHAAETAI